MPKINTRFDELKAFTRDVFSNAAPTDLTGGDIITNLVGHEVILYPDVDIEAFAAKFGKRAGAVRAVLETLKGMQHPEVNMASPETQIPAMLPPPCLATPSAPPMEAPKWPTPGPELLCAASDRLPKQAMLGKDGRLYDRASIAKTPMARDASPDFTMTGAIGAWQEYADDPARLIANMRAAVQCPITLEVPKEPVLAADGFSYERADIILHFQARGDQACSPMTGKPFKHQRLVPNTNLTRLIAAQGLADSSMQPTGDDAQDGRYCTHPRLGAQQITVTDAAHRRAFDTARVCLEKLYAWAPVTLFNKHATGQVAAKACEHLTHVLQSKPAADVRRAALQMRAEIYGLTEAWEEALADLDKLGPTMEVFGVTRRSLALQATGRNAEAKTYLNQAMGQGLTGDLQQNPELLAVLGEFLRHEHRYQLAHHLLRDSQKQAPTTAAARSLSKTRMSMLKRMIIPRQLTEAEYKAALDAGVDA